MLNISIDMILETLERYAPERLFPDTERLYFSSLQLYERGQVNLSPENIYMCAGRELTGDAVASGCCFLCVNGIDPTLRERLKGGRVVLVEDENLGLAAAFNTIQRLFAEMREWHQNMHISLIRNNDVQELLDLSENVIGNPIVLVDLGFKLLAHTRHIITDDEIYNEVVSRGYHTTEAIARLTQNRQVDSIKKADEVSVEFPIPQMTQYAVMTKMFSMHGVPFAYLRMICSSKAPSKSLEEKFALLSESVEYYLHSHYSSGSANKYIYEYVLVELIEKKLTDEDDIEERIKCVGLKKEAEYQLLKIVFEDEANISLQYVLEQLLVIFPESRPFIYRDHIVMLMNCESRYRGAADRKNNQFGRLREFLTYSKAHCGLSEIFSSIIQVSDAYVQATVAEELGQTLQKKRAGTEAARDDRMFSYQDYYAYHMITSCAQEVQLRSLCDRRLLALKEQDEAKRTDYAGLLHTYLLNKCRPTDVGTILHMHRNNVIYHVDRISEQMGIDLQDPETRLRLLLSYKVMELM